MRKLLFFALFILSYTIQAQNHSDLWLKVDEIKRTYYPTTYNNKKEYNGKYGLLSNQQLIHIDNKIVFINLESYNKLDEYTLIQIAGINYIPADDKDAIAIYGTNASNGVIEIYTHTYANANPNVRRRFKITFATPDPWRTNGNEKKSK